MPNLNFAELINCHSREIAALSCGLLQAEKKYYTNFI
jgi:hypothetical protein